MKKLIAVGALLTCFGASAMAGGEGWTSDFEAAKKQAAEGKKDLLIDFTGSDWCIWCKRLNEEVFSKDAFKNGVKDKFVLVELDFPHDKTKISPETKKQNEALSDKFGIQGFPTIVLADAQGRPYAVTGYQKGGAEKYVEHLDELRKKHAARDEAFKKAESLKGIEKAKALAEALKNLELSPSMEVLCYPEIVAEIVKADSKDETGFAAKSKQVQDEAEMNRIGQKTVEMVKAKKFDEAQGFLKKSLDECSLAPEAKQQLAFLEVIIFGEQKKFDDALKALERIKAIAPDSQMAGQLDQVRQQIEAQMKEEKPKDATSSDEAKKKEAPKEAPKPAEAPASK